MHYAVFTMVSVVTICNHTTILLTVFPVLYFSSLWVICFITGSLYPLISFTISHVFLLLMPLHLLLWQAPVCFLYLSLFLFTCLLDSTCKWNHMLFLFLCLTYFTLYNTLEMHPCCWKCQKSHSDIPLCVCVCVCVCVHTYTYYIFHIHISIDGHLGCFLSWLL